jgi:hypothetical protein
MFINYNELPRLSLSTGLLHSSNLSLGQDKYRFLLYNKLSLFGVKALFINIKVYLPVQGTGIPTQPIPAESTTGSNR